jgi:hypothetical protein
MGKPTHAYTGWRRFNFQSSELTKAAEDPDGIIASVVENATTTVVTYNAFSGSSSGLPTDKAPIHGYTAAIPLKTAEGVGISFGDPFILKVRIELINMTGDSRSSAGSDKSKPQVSFGICENAANFAYDDVAAQTNGTNRNVYIGWRNKRDSSASESITETPVMLYGGLSTGGSEHENFGKRNSGITDGTTIIEGAIHVGPDLGADKNTYVSIQGFASSGDDYSTCNGGGNSYKVQSFNTNQGFDADTQVYLFCSLGDCNTLSSSGSRDAAVVTLRMTYLVEADPIRGWGTS